MSTMILSDELKGGAVERGADGLPTAFRVLQVGENKLHLGGQAATLALSEGQIKAIVAGHQAKGLAIPIDAEHALYRLGNKQGVEELAMAGILGEKAAAGWARLEQRVDGLWARVEKWTPRAALLLGQGAYRWFSPVIRDFAGPSPRVTSIAMTNTPALDLFEPLVASANQEDKTMKMATVLLLLGPLVGMPNLALSEAGDVPDELEGKLKGLVPELEGGRKLRAASVKALALSADASTEQIEGSILQAGERLNTGTLALSELQGKVTKLEADAEAGTKAKLIEKGLADGKLNPSLVESWANGQTSVALSAWLASAPVIMPQGQRAPQGQGPSALALSEAEARVFKNCGLPVPGK